MWQAFYLDEMNEKQEPMGGLPEPGTEAHSRLLYEKFNYFAQKINRVIT